MATETNKIDKINVGETVYEINLPTSATPEISSLTITGNLDVARIISAGDYVEGSEGYFTNAYINTLNPNTTTSIQAGASIHPRTTNKYNLGNFSQY